MFHPTSNPYPYLEKERKELDELRARVIEVEQAKNEDENLDITTPKKIGRNDPCPCGSGKKYKHCCGSI